MYKRINGIFISGWGSYNNPNGKILDISSTICARYFKGFDNLGTMGVIEIEKESNDDIDKLC